MFLVLKTKEKHFAPIFPTETPSDRISNSRSASESELNNLRIP